MVRPSILLLFAVACSSPAKPPAAPPPAPPAPVPAPAKFTCTTSSRLCDLVALAASSDLDVLATQLYGDDGAGILAKLRAKQLDPLVVDPGVVLRLDEVLAFPAKPGEDPWLVRERFSAKLGKVRIYRGLAVTPEELASINAKGILAASKRGTEPVPPKHLLDQMIGHLVGIAGPADTMLSISYDPNISRCVAAMYRGKEQQKTVHVWTVEMPLLDVLAIEAPHALCPAVEPASLECDKRRGEITPATRLAACRNFYDPKIESFVQSRIDPSEFVEVKPETGVDDCKDVIAGAKKSLNAKRDAQKQFCKPAKNPMPPPGPPQVITPTELKPATP